MIVMLVITQAIALLSSMKLTHLLPLVGAAWAIPQSATTSTETSTPTSSASSSPLQSGVAPVGNYEGKLRPQVHFSPPVGFMNDPNGLFIDSRGVYHQYYQYNPYNTVAGNQTWGHATSTDLLHWQNQPIALAPLNGTDLVFSGSAVVDVNNTSGFFPNQTNGVVAIFTVATPYQQSQSIAYSFDDGYTFTRYSGNPILEIGSSNFRDPKVIWHEPTARWVMILSFAQDFTIGFYTSEDLKDWTHVSNWTGHGLLGYQYECPNMVQMPMEGQDEPMWLMYVSINPGAPYGGSTGQYWPGDFNGTHFTAVDSVARIADFGKDNYASQFYYGIPGNQPQLSIGWASNWEYTNRVPTGPAEGWASVFSLPRVNYLRNATRIGYQLVSEPYNIDSLKPQTALFESDDFGNASSAARYGLNGASGAILLEANITGLNTTGTAFASSLNFTFASSTSGESFSGGQFFTGDYIFWMDRSKILGFEDPFFTGKFSQSFLFEDHYDLKLIVDRGLIEAFILRGEKSGTLSMFPQAALDTVTVSTAGINPGAQVSIGVWELGSVWASTTNASGVVNGNSTLS